MMISLWYDDDVDVENMFDPVKKFRHYGSVSYLESIGLVLYSMYISESSVSLCHLKVSVFAS